MKGGTNIAFQGHKYTFRFNAIRSTSQAQPHRQAFEFSLYIKSNIEFESYSYAEDIVNSWLSTYANATLNNTPPFDKVSPTLENMGNVFYQQLLDLLEKSQLKLIRLDISDSPKHILSFGEITYTQDKERKLKQAVDKLAQIVPSEPSLPTTQATSSDSTKNHSNKNTSGISDINKAVPVTSNLKITIPTTKTGKAIFWLSVLLVIIGGFIAMQIVKVWGMYPLGFDVHGHLFKADVLYNEISQGNFYPLYTEYWYNGIQLFRYWPPMTYYVMAAFQFITGGDVMAAYLGFVWLVFSAGGIGWLLFSRKLRRPLLGIFLAFAWFFLPDNLRVLFGEGNLPRVFITTLIPYILYFIWCFVKEKENRKVFPLIAFMLVAIFSHLMIAAMIGVGSFIFLLIYSIMNKEYQRSATAIIAMLFSFAIMGFWVYPALVGGLTNMASDGTSELMMSLSEPLSVSLNPIIRIDNIGNLYFGLSIAVIALLGLLLANKKSKSGFLFLLIIIAGTTTLLTPIIAKIPYSELFWVRRFAPLAYGGFVIALFEWKRLKKPILVLFCLLMTADFVPSTNLAAYNSKMNIPARVQDFDSTMEDYLFKAAKDNASQRVSLMDLSQLGPFPSYAFGTLESKTPYTFGWAWQGASTAMNISYLNEALETQNYLYMFDRHIELGADEILINKANVNNRFEELIAAAKVSGYTLTDETEHTMLFSLDVEGEFGVVSDYTALAIGSTAALVPQILPFYRPGDKLTIDEYTIEELMQYDMIYLSGFFYEDKDKAETLVREAAEKGIKIYVDMSRIPADPLTSRMTFLDVSAQPIIFDNRFPDIITDEKTISPVPFSEGYEQWNTVYLTGLKTVDGYAWFNRNRLNAFGRGDDENIFYIGFNLFFHSYANDDPGVKALMGSIMSLNETELPKRTLVPIEITHEQNKIIIKSEYDNVNTTLAWQDIFESEQPIKKENNLLVVNKGTTVITMHYPYIEKGIAITIVGILVESLLVWLLFKKKKVKDNGN